MRRVSQHKDANHDEIVSAYRKHHCAVVSLVRVGNGCPDLLVLSGGRLALVEVKTKKGALRPCQAEFAAIWPVRVVRDVDDVAEHVTELTLDGGIVRDEEAF